MAESQKIDIGGKDCLALMTAPSIISERPAARLLLGATVPERLTRGGIGKPL